MPRGCVIRIVAPLALVLIALLYIVNVGSRAVDERLRLCGAEADSAIEGSAERTEELAVLVDSFSKGETDIESALQGIEELRATRGGIVEVLAAQAAEGRCRLENRPVSSLLEVEQKANEQAAEFASLLIRGERHERSARRFADEAEDYRRRYERLKQEVLLAPAKEFEGKAADERKSARRLKADSDEKMRLMQKSIEEHEALVESVS